MIAAVGGFDGVSIQARKTYVALVTPRRTFAVVQASAKKRVDVGLRFGDVAPQGRLLDAKNVGDDSITRRIALASVDELDADALAWIRRAYDENR